MMASKSFVFRFADIEVHEREFRLIKAAEMVPVEPKAFRVLLFLLHNPQRLIKKEELLGAVWNDSVVSENSLARSIGLLRRLLGDDIHDPRFIATVATVGYRFIGEVEVAEDTNHGLEEGSASIDVGTHPEARPVSPPGGRASGRTLWWTAGVAAVLLGLAVVALFVWWDRFAMPVVDGALQLTDDGNPKLLTTLASDGSRIYFNEIQEGREVIAQVAATGGQTRKIAGAPSDGDLAALASDSSSLLVKSGSLGYLWLLPLPAGEARKLPDPFSDAATLFPDGRVVFTSNKSLFIAEKDGSNPRKLSEFPGVVGNPVVSSDGKRIRLNSQLDSFTRSIWEVNADGSGAHALLQGWQSAGDVCCGRWTADGKYFVFQNRRQGRTDLWAIREVARWFERASPPIRLTNGPLSYELPLPSPDGKHLYAIGMKQRGELVRYDGVSGEFVPYLSGISATDVSVSRDEKWLTYMSFPERSLWRSRMDGSERLQLTYPPVSVIYPRISPDGTRVSYGSLDANGRNAAFILSLEGGTPRKIASGTAGAGWSPDGNSVVVGVKDRPAEISRGIQTIELNTGKIHSIPDSAGKGGILWPMPDMLIAYGIEGPGFGIFDLKTQKWSEFVKALPYHWMPSVDGKYFYWMVRHDASVSDDTPRILRIRLSDRKVETIASLKNFRPAEDEVFGDWLGVAPDGSPLLTRDIGTAEIYDLNVRWR